jgi:hypothetical protein
MATIVVAVALVGPASAAAASGHGGGGPSLPVVPAFLGIPSISSILRSIANDLFNVLAGAFLPSWLRNAPASTLRWLVALPNPADAVQWPTMHHLEQDTSSVAVAFLPLTLAVATARYTASGVVGGVHHPAESLGRLIAAAFGLLIFPWAFSNVVAAVNVTTSALIAFPDIDHGLQRALSLMFAGGLLFGVTGPLVAVLVIGAIMLAAGLFVMKVGILALFAILFVAGPLTLAGYPIPELHGAFRLWCGLLIGLAMIPIGWCVMFAVAGAISADITHIGTPAAIGTRIVGFFAGVLTFFIAYRWPFFLIHTIRSRGLLPADLSGAGAAGAGGGVAGSLGERAAQGRLALLAAGGAVGSAVSAVGAAAGAPRGGLAAAGARVAGGGVRWAAGGSTAIRYRAGAGAGWQSVRERAAASRVAQTRARQRAATAGAVLGAAPAAVRAAVTARNDPDHGRGAGEAALAAVTITDGADRDRRRNGNTPAPDAAPRSEPEPRPAPLAGARRVVAGHSEPSGSSARAPVEAAAAAGAAVAAAQAAQQHVPPPRPRRKQRPAGPTAPPATAGASGGGERARGAAPKPPDRTPPRAPSTGRKDLD